MELGHLTALLFQPPPQKKSKANALLCSCVRTCEHSAHACPPKNVFGDAQSSPLMPSATRRRGHIPGPTISDVGAKGGPWWVGGGCAKGAAGASNAPIVSAAQNASFFFPPRVTGTSELNDSPVCLPASLSCITW